MKKNEQQGGQQAANPTPAGPRSYIRELVFASVVALTAAAGAAQAVAGFTGGNRKSVSNGGDILLLAGVLLVVWLWGYWARASRRKLALEARFRAEVDAMRAELRAELLATNEGLNGIADMLDPPGPLAVVRDFPVR